jgi:hypothetical protein
MMIGEQDTKGVPRELDEVSVMVEDAQETGDKEQQRPCTWSLQLPQKGQTYRSS